MANYETLFPAIYCSKSLTFLQVGMKTVGYEEQIQKPAYDITSLFGKFRFSKIRALVIIIAKKLTANNRSL